MYDALGVRSGINYTILHFVQRRIALKTRWTLNIFLSECVDRLTSRRRWPCELQRRFSLVFRGVNLFLAVATIIKVFARYKFLSPWLRTYIRWFSVRRKRKIGIYLYGSTWLVKCVVARKALPLVNQLLNFGQFISYSFYLQIEYFPDEFLRDRIELRRRLSHCSFSLSDNV